MINPDDSAFPVKSKWSKDIGLTKREYFAAMAMQGLSANPYDSKDKLLEDWEIARIAISIADELIKKLNE